jgi:muramoyltetrapeptide carboxypeptidase
MKKCSILGSTYYTSNNELKKIGDNMRELGFSDYSVFNSKNNNFGKWAGTPEERLKLFYDSWESDDDAIFSIRGGSGASHFVSKIEVERLNRRKMFVGYSDLTLILNYLNSKLGLITLHGPMAVADLDYTSLYFLKRALAMQNYSIDFSKRSVINGSDNKIVKGKMIGGNLTRLIESLLHFDLDFKDKVVFLEETGESQAKVLNMLFTLSAYGSFKPSAIVLGYMGIDISKDLEEMISGIFPDVPIVYNLPFGHNLPNVSIPIGASGVIDFEKGKLSIEFPEDHRDYAIDLELDDAQEPESCYVYLF